MLGTKETVKVFLWVWLMYGAWYGTSELTKLFDLFLHHQINLSTFQIGLINIVGGAFMLIGTFLVGHLMDTMGFTTVGVATIFITALFYMLTSQIQSFTSLICIQPLKMGHCLNQVAEGYLASVIEPHERTKGFMRLGVAIAIGTVVGPIIAMKLTSFGIRSAETWNGVILMALCLPSIIFLPKPARLPQSKQPRITQISDYREMLRSKPLQMALLIKFLLAGPFQVYATTSRQFLIGLIITNVKYFIYFVALIVTAIILATTVFFMVLQKGRPQQMLRYMLIVLAIAFVVVSFATEYYKWFLIIVIQIGCLQFVYAEFTAEIVNAVNRLHYGKAVGLGIAVQLLAGTLTSVAAEYFLLQYNFALWCYLSSAVCFIVVLILPYAGVYAHEAKD